MAPHADAIVPSGARTVPQRILYLHMTTPDLFEPAPSAPDDRLVLGAQAAVIRGLALPLAEDLIAAIEQITQAAPFRHLVTPGGFRMSVAMSNCGRLGWVSDRRGYRYDARDPDSGQPWPSMPDLFLELARTAAAELDFSGYVPDACLINRYIPGARMSLHQDRDEDDAVAPIVSVSLGLPARFQFGGFARSDPPQRCELFHGDVTVWGGVDRMRYHGVMPLKDGEHPLLGAQRLNLTFRKVR